MRGGWRNTERSVFLRRRRKTVNENATGDYKLEASSQLRFGRNVHSSCNLSREESKKRSKFGGGQAVHSVRKISNSSPCNAPSRTPLRWSDLPLSFAGERDHTATLLEVKLPRTFNRPRPIDVRLPSTLCALLTALIFTAPVSAEDAVQPPNSTAAAVTELEHLHHVSKRILSGSEPHSTSAFRYLKAAGVKTIVSVDGAKPRVAAAKAEGLRYVHIPIGYDGIPQSAKLSLLRVLRDTEGGIYIHCHHGKHRGPAAAAMACRLEGSVDRDEALQILKQAGTSPDYAGLWRDVREFEMPPADAKLPKLVETAKIESMASAMAVLSRHFDNLKSIQQANWNTPAKHPDLVPVEESLLVAENLHEANRNLGHGYDQQFRAWLKESETQAQRLHAAVKSDDNAAADGAMKSLLQNCRQCHESYRN